MARQRAQQIGVFGGTFNPIHLGHLLVAQDAWEQCRLDRVKFIPAATPPHKTVPDLASASARWQMVRRAIRGQPHFEAEDIELKRGGVSYSIDTILELRRRHPGARFHVIIGADTLRELHTWREATRLMRLCEFIVVPRPGSRPQCQLPVRYQIVAGHLCDIASRDIRERIGAGKSIRYLVPDAVIRYIRQHQLYL